MGQSSKGKHDSSKGNTFFVVTLAGVILGIILGLILRPCQIQPDTLLVITYPGEIFLRILELMTLPFVISCIIIGTAGLNIRKNGRIAVRTIIYFLSTSALNVVLGLILVVLIHPGNPKTHTGISNVIDTNQSKLLDGFLDMGRNLVPDNLFQATFQQTYTKYVPVDNMIDNKIGATTAMKRQLAFKLFRICILIIPWLKIFCVPYTYFNYATSEYHFAEYLDIAGNTKADEATKEATSQIPVAQDGTNTIGIICFCIMFGSVLGTLGSEKKVVIDFFSTAFTVLLKMLMGAIWLTPLGVGSIICGKIISIPDLTLALAQISWYIITVTVGVLIYQLIILQFIYFVYIGKNPYKFYWTFKPSIMTGIATASKAAAYPITFQLFDETIKMDKRISRFILPLGTLNMDGVALFLSVAVVFIAQLNNIPLELGDYIAIGFTCTATSMSSATVPTAALLLVPMLCSIINAPTEDVSLLFAVDWLVDRIRTTNNILGDCYACAVIESLSKKELSIMPEEMVEDTSEETSKLEDQYPECIPDGEVYRISNNF